MNLRGLANRVTQAVNPNTAVTVSRSTGYGIGPGRKQVPAYADPVGMSAQIQALDSDDLKHIDSLNIQGEIRSIYLFGGLTGTLRVNEQGGDLITVAAGVHVGVWLVVKVIETWPDWTKAVIVRQLDTP